MRPAAPHPISVRSVPGWLAAAPPRGASLTAALLLLSASALLPVRPVRAQQSPGTSAGSHVPQPELEAAAKARYATDCPFSETRYEPSPRGRPVKLQQPTDESSDCGTVAAQKSYGVSPVGLPFTETTTETGRRRRLLTDGAGHQVEVLAAPGGIAARTYRYSARGLLRARATPEADGNLNDVPTDEDATTGEADTRLAYDRAGDLRFRQDAAKKRRGRSSSSVTTRSGARPKAE